MSLKTKADVLLGLQWGDEGKGKIVDVLTPRYKLVARFQGGPNAGHTLEFENKKFVLHTIPSGIFRSGCINLIGSGVVLDPYVFHKEVNHLGLGDHHLRMSLLISSKAHLILPSHRLMDAANEQAKGAENIGSTLKGIGPTYTDKVARCGLRLADALLPGFRERYERLKEYHFSLIDATGYDRRNALIEGISFSAYEEKWFEGLEMISKLEQVESEIYVNQALDQGVQVLAEGAQGSLLDIDFGSYPFVTSSTTLTAGACIGLGLAPSRIGEVYGIFKAYCTRVGSGPFPTELNDADGDMMRKNGREFGSTTGRSRRCGWLDLPALKYAIMLNGVTRLIMTKADVLSGFERIKACVAYRYKGNEINYPPTAYQADQLQPVYKELPAWQEDISACQEMDELPETLMQYIRFIEGYTGVDIWIVSTGPNRMQTIFSNGK